MKKHALKIALVLLLVVAMVLPGIPTIATEGETAEGIVATGDWYNDGAGVDGKFIISTAGDLKYFMSLNDSFSGKTVYLGADIDWNDVDSIEELMALESPNVWTPFGVIANESSYYPLVFQGTFDGQGHSINGLYMEATGNNIGFFGRLTKATVKNVSFTNGYMHTTGTADKLIGFVAGGASNTCTFENVSVNAHQIHNSTSAESRIGGMVGYLSSAATSTFTNCIVSGKIEAKSAQVVGGIVGANHVEYKNSKINNGTVTMTDCINYATVACKLEGAGLVGRVSGHANLTRCMSFGKVTAETTVDADEVDLKVAVASLVYARFKVFDGADAVTPTNNYSTDRDIKLYDCVHVMSSAAYPVVVHYNKAERDYSVIVYKDGTASTTIACRGNTNERSDNYADASNIRQNRMATNGQVLTFDAATTDVVEILGLQTRTSADKEDTADIDESKVNVDIRLVAGVSFNDTLNASNIVEVGFEARTLSAYLADADKALKGQSCSAVYTSIIGGGEVLEAEKDFGADYLATMLLGYCPTGADTADSVSDDINSVLFRSYCKDGDGNVYYSSYFVFTFVGNRVVGCVTL